MNKNESRSGLYCSAFWPDFYNYFYSQSDLIYLLLQSTSLRALFGNLYC